ncbi:MAG: hypothetical protein AABX37_01885 [Nanoarchaeota archaeon]
MKKEWMILFFLSVIFIISCSPSIPLEKQCISSSDCVPAACCHATEAVNSQYAPDCTEAICTMDCAPGTLDCGQGEIQCMEGSCVVVFNEEKT